MKLDHLSFQGSTVDDFTTFAKLPSEMRALLEQINGFVQFGGGLHIRGACVVPDWHSLAEVWFGSLALWKIYPVLRPDDVPFGQDAVGDQFIWREGVVHQLSAETGDLHPLDYSFLGFLEAAQSDPLEVLGLHPLLQFQNEGGQLQPGQLLSVYPPFCTKQAASGVSLKAVPVADRIKFLGDFASQIVGLSDGVHIRLTV